MCLLAVTVLAKCHLGEAETPVVLQIAEGQWDFVIQSEILHLPAQMDSRCPALDTVFMEAI